MVIGERWIGKDKEESGRGLIQGTIPVLSGGTEQNRLSQDSRSPGRDLNTGRPEYEAGVLTTRPRRSVRRILLHGVRNNTVEPLGGKWICKTARRFLKPHDTVDFSWQSTTVNTPVLQSGARDASSHTTGIVTISVLWRGIQSLHTCKLYWLHGQNVFNGIGLPSRPHPLVETYFTLT
jgi:hypothetical protein